jgi:hypothetical protein
MAGGKMEPYISMSIWEGRGGRTRTYGNNKANCDGSLDIDIGINLDARIESRYIAVLRAAEFGIDNGERLLDVEDVELLIPVMGPVT